VAVEQQNLKKKFFEKNLPKKSKKISKKILKDVEEKIERMEKEVIDRITIS
jgi:hypothetical protein